MKRALLLIVLCGLVGFLCSYLFAPTTNPLNHLKEQQAQERAAREDRLPDQAPVVDEKQVLPKTKSETRRRFQNLSEIVPSPETVREEVQKDPHTTPRSLILFSAELGKRMELALKNEAAAVELFPELSDCARDQPKGAYPLSAQTLCYTDASELAKKVAGLSPKLEALKKDLDPETLKRFESMDRVIAPGER